MVNEVAIRPIERADHAFIYQSFLKNFIPGSIYSKTPRSWAVFHDIMEHYLLNFGGFVVCEPGDQALIYSWLVGSKQEGLVYVYTRLASRGSGYATALVQKVFGVQLPKIDIVLDHPKVAEFRKSFANASFFA